MGEGDEVEDAEGVGPEVSPEVAARTGGGGGCPVCGGGGGGEEDFGYGAVDDLGGCLEEVDVAAVFGWGGHCGGVGCLDFCDS